MEKITYKEIDLEIIGVFQDEQKSNDNEVEHIEACYNIESIYCGHFDIIDIITDKAKEEIEHICINRNLQGIY